MNKKIISYTLTQEELEKLLSTEYGTKVEPVDIKRLDKHKNNQQRARELDKKKV